ncbi:MAG: universal stress protein [Armatimonadota bacterium]
MYDRILLPLDGSKTAEAAIPHARVMANAFNSVVTLFFVIEPALSLPETNISAALTIPTPPDVLPDETGMRNAEEYLRSVAEPLRRQGIRVETVIKHGSPGDEICDYLESGYTDMVVMTTHGRSGFQRFVYGSVAEHVLRNSFTPVLLIRIQPKQAE